VLQKPTHSQTNNRVKTLRVEKWDKFERYKRKKIKNKKNKKYIGQKGKSLIFNINTDKY